MADEFKPGDHVEWDTSQGTTGGTVEHRLTGETHIKGFTAKPTPGDPEYLVKSDKSGKEAAHKPSELRKRGGARNAAKKSTAKKSTAKKSTAKKSTAKKSTPKKAAARKVPAKRSAAKKTSARKATAKRATARKAGARKGAATRGRR